MIFYFTGTGNTRWVAQQLAKATGEGLLFIPDEMKKDVMRYELEDGERLGFCFPTHGWQPPRIVREFIRKAQFVKSHTDLTDHTEIRTNTDCTDYVYAVTTCGDNMGHAMRILNKELKQKGLHTNSVFAVLMPESNVCFSFLHLDTKEREREKIAAAQQTVAHICDVVSQRRKGVTELIRGAIPYTYTYVIGGYYNKHLITDEKFWVGRHGVHGHQKSLPADRQDHHQLQEQDHKGKNGHKKEKGGLGRIGPHLVQGALVDDIKTKGPEKPDFFHYASGFRFFPFHRRLPLSL
ncbi:MAG: EFR1 family ferrodoxin [Lachnospiraceae bacterium]|nr:EFR1 family ferrodoxin [Lachnospiraceae bacterium]